MSGLKKKVVLVVGVLVLLLAAAGGIYYYMTNTPKNKYLLSEKRSYDQWNDYLAARYEPEFELQKNMTDDSYLSTLTLSATASEKFLSILGITQETLDATQLKFTMGHDRDLEQSKLAIEPTIASTEIDPFSWTADKDAQYAEAPILDNKLMVKNKDMKAVYERLTGEKPGKDFDPDMFNLNKLMEGDFTQEEIQDLQIRYLDVFMDSLTGEQFEKGKEKTVVFGETETLNTVTMTLENDDIKRIIENVLTEMKTDEEIKKWYDSTLADVNGDSYEKMLDDALKENKNETYGKVIAKNYMDGKDVLKRNIDLMPAEGGTYNVTIMQRIGDDVQFDIVAFEKGSDETFHIEGTSTGTGDVKDDYTVTIGDDEQPFMMHIVNTENVDNDERKNTINVAFIENNETFFSTVINNVMVTDTKNNQQTSQGSLTFDIEDEPVTFNFDTTTKLKQKLNVKPDGAVDLHAMSDEEFNELKEMLTDNLDLLLSQLSIVNSY